MSELRDAVARLGRRKVHINPHLPGPDMNENGRLVLNPAWQAILDLAEAADDTIIDGDHHVDRYCAASAHVMELAGGKNE